MMQEKPMDRCGAKTRSGEPCKRRKSIGRTRCKMHGGGSPIGSAHPSYRTGRYSRYLPFGLAEKFEQALEDPDWLSLEKEIRLIDATLAEVLGTFGKGQIREYEVERMTSLIDQRRKLVESEQKRLKDHQHMISIEQMLGLTKLVLSSIEEVSAKYVTSGHRSSFLAAINEAVHRLLSRSNPREIQSVKQIN